MQIFEQPGIASYPLGLFLFCLNNSIQHLFCKRDKSWSQMNSLLKTIDSSPSLDKMEYSFSLPNSVPLENAEISPCDQINAEDKDVQKQDRSTIRRSCMQLEGYTQILIQNMIIDEIQMQGKVRARKMSLDNDETCIFSADVYAKDEIHWKNREITHLTTKKMAEVPIENIKKIKVCFDQPMNGYRLFKITVLDKEIKEYAIRNNDIGEWLSNSVWVCLATRGISIPVKRQFEGEIEGYIYKKSQFLGNWDKRYTNISAKNGLLSFKKKDGHATVQIKDSTQVWTRLDTSSFKGQSHLIIKIWHMMFKYEFAVPLSDCLRWLKAFSLLVK